MYMNFKGLLLLDILHQTFGFATEEYQVTPERLGVYLPVVSACITSNQFNSETKPGVLGTY